MKSVAVSLLFLTLAPLSAFAGKSDQKVQEAQFKCLVACQKPADGCFEKCGKKDTNCMKDCGEQLTSCLERCGYKVRK